MPYDIKEIIPGSRVSVDKSFNTNIPRIVTYAGEHLVVLGLEESAGVAERSHASVLITDVLADAQEAARIVKIREQSDEEKANLKTLCDNHRKVNVTIYHLQRITTAWRDLFPGEREPNEDDGEDPYEDKTFLLENFPVVKDGMVIGIYTGEAACTKSDGVYFLKFTVEGEEAIIQIVPSFLDRLKKKMESHPIKVGVDLPVIGAMPSVISLVDLIKKNLPASKQLGINRICAIELFIMAKNAGLDWIAPAVDNKELRDLHYAIALKDLADHLAKVDISKENTSVDPATLGKMIKK